MGVAISIPVTVAGVVAVVVAAAAAAAAAVAVGAVGAVAVAVAVAVAGAVAVVVDGFLRISLSRHRKVLASIISVFCWKVQPPRATMTILPAKEDSWGSQPGCSRFCFVTVGFRARD